MAFEGGDLGADFARPARWADAWSWSAIATELEARAGDGVPRVQRAHASGADQRDSQCQPPMSGPIER